jgi:hypothetical protein
MAATVSSISKHRRYEHAYFRRYRRWINKRRETEYRAKGWALEPVPVLSARRPNIRSEYCYEGLLKAYKIKLEIDSVTAFLKGKVVEKPEIFSPDIIRRCKLLDEAIAKNFGVDISCD